jgi:hypothetical protein
MNVVLTAEEILKIYEMLLRSQSDEILTSKFKAPIQDILERQEDAFNKEKYESWAKIEEKKINELRNLNQSLILKKAAKTEPRCGENCTRCSHQKEAKVT